MNQLRIIAGKWRSRKLQFPDNQALRPTPDRVRETLFNWLSPYIHGAQCLDLFAGSGALGFEALSRGANHVVMIDNAHTTTQQLQASAEQLNASNVTIYQAKIPDNMQLHDQKFDIIFLDPPFLCDLVIPTLDDLLKSSCLKETTLVYVEVEKHYALAQNLKDWAIIKHKKAGKLQYALLQYAKTS